MSTTHIAGILITFVVLVILAGGLFYDVALEKPESSACDNVELGPALQNVSADSILATVKTLCGHRSRRFTTPGAAAAVGHITATLRRLGLPVEHHRVDARDRHGDTVVVTNVVVPLGPVDDNALIICAHYDSRGEDWLEPAPGADDNASGVAVLLETARVIRDADIEPAVTLVFFGGEEDDLIGSRAFARHLAEKGNSYRGVINVDMVGYDEHGPRDVVIFTNPQSIPLVTEMWDAALPFSDLVVDTTVTSMGNSDHAAFWEHALQAVSIWEGYDHNPYHQTREDMPSKLTRGFLEDVTRWIVAAAVCMSPRQ
ncbi:MAG: Zn-dependent exopeptidase M28 [Candidatus Latescibacterota bacterium]|nr:MAG: Zn-dependent exopeptidase M28 [Candidatus Latescibacterota bacterium]